MFGLCLGLFGTIWDYLVAVTCFTALCLLPVSTAGLPHCEDVSYLQFQ